MTILTASALTKTFGPHSVLAGVDLSIHQGERVGLVGANGSGKSTLARILAAQDTPDTGEVAVRRDARVMYLAQEPDARSRAHGARYRADGPDHLVGRPSERYEQASRELEQGVTGRSRQGPRRRRPRPTPRSSSSAASTSPTVRSPCSALSACAIRKRKVGSMSGGEQRRVALARLLVAEPELAILDEPTNHLDIDAIEWLETHLADQFRGAVLLISHDRYFLDGVVDRTLEVERGKIFGYEGGFADYLRGKAERIALAERTEQNRQNFLRKELDWLSRSPPARTTKQQARIERAEQAVASRPAPKAQKLELELATARGGKSILDLERVSIDSPAEARAPRRLITTSRCTSRRASGSASWVPTAAARAPCCGRSSASTRS